MNEMKNEIFVSTDFAWASVPTRRNSQCRLRSPKKAKKPRLSDPSKSKERGERKRREQTREIYEGRAESANSATAEGDIVSESQGEREREKKRERETFFQSSSSSSSLLLSFFWPWEERRDKNGNNQEAICLQLHRPWFYEWLISFAFQKSFLSISLFRTRVYIIIIAFSLH